MPYKSQPKQHPEPVEVLEDPDVGILPDEEADDGLVLPLIDADPEHDRVIDPED